MITASELADYEQHRWIERLTQHLDQVPVILQHLRESAVPLAAGSLKERVTGGGGEASAPLRVDAVDDADHLWATFAEYGFEVAKLLDDGPADPLLDAWTAYGLTQGLRADTTPTGAYSDALALVAWIVDRAARIHMLALTEQEEHLLRLIRKLWARYIDDKPRIRAQYRAVCTVCGERTVDTAWVIGDTGEAVCATCGATYTNEREESTS